jgi:hypothetical protein
MQIKTGKIVRFDVFNPRLIYGSDSKRKYWYKQKVGKPGKQLPSKYKRMFADKQIVCIEYMEITEDDEREIFRVRLPVSNFLFAELTLFTARPTGYGSQLR